jgi:hypothetical protein
LHASGFNFAAVWAAGKITNVISNSVFHYDLNRYNSIDHLAIGVGIGTLAYKKSGGGLRGVLTGLIAGTMFNAGWEALEYKYHIWNTKESVIDTVTDIAFVYAGNILGFLSEKAKENLNRKKK